MESSNPTSLTEANKQILLKHLGNLDEKILETFMKALCQLKPRRGAGRIRMVNLKDKSLKEIVEFIFKYHTEKHGAETVRKALAMINENQTRMLMDRELREASTSNVMVHKQDGKQVYTIIPNIAVPTAYAVTRSEPSAHKIKGEPDRDAVLGTATNREATSSTNEGPAHNPPKPASTSNVMVHKQDEKPVYIIIPNIGVPTARAVPCSETSAKTIKIEHDSDAVLGTPTNKQATASKIEGAAHNPPKPASTSNVMVHKQDGKQVYNFIPNIGVPTASALPRSEPSAKTIKIEHDSNAVLGNPTNKQAAASTNGGPAYNPPKPASTSNVMVHKQDGKPVYNFIPNIGVPTARAVPCSEPSAKKIRKESDRDAVLGTPMIKQATASENEGPAHKPPKPEKELRKKGRDNVRRAIPSPNQEQQPQHQQQPQPSPALAPPAPDLEEVAHVEEATTSAQESALTLDRSTLRNCIAKLWTQKRKIQRLGKKLVAVDVSVTNTLYVLEQL